MIENIDKISTYGQLEQHEDLKKKLMTSFIGIF